MQSIDTKAIGADLVNFQNEISIVLIQSKSLRKTSQIWHPGLSLHIRRYFVCNGIDGEVTDRSRYLKDYLLERQKRKLKRYSFGFEWANFNPWNKKQHYKVAIWICPIVEPLVCWFSAPVNLKTRKLNNHHQFLSCHSILLGNYQHNAVWLF